MTIRVEQVSLLKPLQQSASEQIYRKKRVCTAQLEKDLFAVAHPEPRRISCLLPLQARCPATESSCPDREFRKRKALVLFPTFHHCRRRQTEFTSGLSIANDSWND